MKIRTRPAVVADAPHLPGIERSSGERFRELPELAWIADDAVQSEERHVALIENGAAWVATDETDTLIGFLNGDIIDGHLHIFEFAVRFDCQGRGVGRALFEQAKHFAIQRSLKGMTLTTFREVAWNEPFYHRLGFATFTQNELTADLARILAEEAESGLPPERRCAMRMAF
jgi:GNAT superfamily N-acetyltransferase